NFTLWTDEPRGLAGRSEHGNETEPPGWTSRLESASVRGRPLGRPFPPGGVGVARTPASRDAGPDTPLRSTSVEPGERHETRRRRRGRRWTRAPSGSPLSCPKPTCAGQRPT